MQRFLLTTLLCLFALVMHADRMEYFSTSFDEGFPAYTFTYDRDEQPLHFTMVQAGFDQGDSWKVFTIDGNSYAASPARHKVAKGETAVAADDWLVLPSVRILDIDAKLTWRAKTIAESIEEGCSYEVRISSNGPDPECFGASPVCTVEAEKLGEWTTHSVDLGDCAGGVVWVAFIHTSLNREILAVDDICFSGGTGRYTLTDHTQRYQYDSDATTLRMSVKSTSERPITAFWAYLDTPEGRSIEQREYKGLNLTPDSPPFDIEFTLPHPLQPGESFDYSLSIELPDNGVEFPPLLGSVTKMLFPTHRRAVAEEGTGMWCGYCPRGIVAMREMRKKYPDDFIGIAVHYDDVLGTAVADYCSKLAFPSFPSAYVNRTTLCGDPMPQDAQGRFSISEGLERSFKEAMTDAAPADLVVAWTMLSNGRLALTADAHFAVTAYDTDYRFAAMVVEDEVSNSTYYQTNYYSGSNVPLGGFEAEDKKIQPYTFDEVARGALLPFEGREGDIPAHVEAGRHYTLTTDVKAPALSSLQHSRMVLMLLDARSGEVVNAVQAAPLSQAEYDAFLTGVSLTPTLPHSSAPAYGLDGRRFDAGAAASSLPGRRVSIEGGKKHLR